MTTSLECDNLTILKFGYSGATLSKESHKLIVTKCKFCEKIYDVEYRKGKNSVCKSCNSVYSAYVMSKETCDKHEFYSRIINSRKEVNIEETIKRFGYDPTKLAVFSPKKVMATCDFCLRVYETDMHTISGSMHITCKKCCGTASHYSMSNLKQEMNCNQFYRYLKEKNLNKINQFIDMIDVDETIKKFSYSPLELNYCSPKKIIAKCQFCDEHTTFITGMAYLIRHEGRVACSKECRDVKTSDTIMRNHGVSRSFRIPSVRKKLANPITERLVESILKKYGVAFERQYYVGRYSFNFYVPDSNLLIECQGDFYHNFKNNKYDGSAVDRNKAVYVNKNSQHKLIHIWEHEMHLGRLDSILSKHITRIQNELIFNLSDLTLRKISIDEASYFLSQCHYLGNLNSTPYHYGSFYGDEMIAVCSFGSTTRQTTCGRIKKLTGLDIKNDELKELKRFCVRPNVKVDNVPSYLLKRFIKLFMVDKPNTKTVISFSDQTVGHHGTIYKASGWSKIGETSNSYHYLDEVSMKAIHKKTVYNQAGNVNMKEKDFVDAVGLVKVPELPKSLWMFRIK
jgi:very-short-patch-repair endonuclease